MAQETRKDPRAKVLTMTVRYKSATLDEFIEHHSHDVSRGGMFIKTPSPFPPGTLLKFEVKIAEDQKVIQGVGRVVWKRENETGDKERPSGMGVKFIKIDDASRKIIDQLVTARGDASAAYESGGGDGGSATTAPSVTPAAAMSPAPLVEKQGAPRKATMIGLGALGAQAAAKAAESAPAPPVGNMFPSDSSSEADMPPPEDRTVMKQAAELLKDALREAGGSMDEVGTKADARAAESAKPAADKPAAAREPKPSEAPAEKSGGPHTLRSEPPKSEKPQGARPVAAAVTAGDRPRSQAAATARSSTRPQPLLAEAPADGGGSRILIILAAIAAAAGAVFFLTKNDQPPTEPTPEPPAAQAPEAPAPAAVEEPRPAEPLPPTSAAPLGSASAAPAPSATPASSATPTLSAAPVTSAAPALKTPPAVTPPVKPQVAPPVVAAPPKPAAAPAPPKPKPTPPPASEPPAEVAPPAAPEPQPAEPKPAPAPKPKPAEPAGDNPY